MTSTARQQSPARQRMRDEINDAVPLRQPKPTVAAWLQRLDAQLAACTTREEDGGLLLSDEVCRAGRTLKGAARERLQELMDAALTRHH